MGLDMYLYKVKKPQPDINVTAKDIYNIDGYLDYMNDESAKENTLKEWNGREIPNLELVELYQPQFQNTYGSYDKLKYCPYKSIMTMIKDWRKANAIHKWFVDTTQDGKDECEPSFVTKEQFEDLLDKCQTILKYKNDPDQLKLIAKKELPVQQGFFFGSYDYDEWYVRDLEQTVSIVTDILKNNDFDDYHYIYQASW